MIKNMSEMGGCSNALTSYTVGQRVELVGESCFYGQPDRVIVHPNHAGDGVRLLTGNGNQPIQESNLGKYMRIPVRLDTVDAKREYGARFLAVENPRYPGCVWRVVEHTLAGLFGALGPSGSAFLEVPVRSQDVFFPVLGPGIENSFEALLDAKIPVSKPRFSHEFVALRLGLPPVRGLSDAYTITSDNESVTYTEQAPELGKNLYSEPKVRKIRFFKTSTPEAPIIRINSSEQPDVPVVGKLQPQPFEGVNTPEFLHTHPEVREARALGRLGNRLTYSLFETLKGPVGFNMITDKNYLIASPHDTDPTLFIKKMAPAFQAGQNERFAHSFLDRIPEIALIPGAVRCNQLGLNVEVRNANHLFMMRAIRALVKGGFFEPAYATRE